VARLEPVLEAGPFPGVKVNFVEAGVAPSVKAMDDVTIPAATGEHGVKVKLDVGRELGGFAAGPSAIYDFRLASGDLWRC